MNNKRFYIATQILWLLPLLTYVLEMVGWSSGVSPMVNTAILGTLAIGGGIALGSQLLGAGANKLFNKKPKAPEFESVDYDLVDPVTAIYDRQRTKTQSALDERTDKAEASAAAQGLSSSAQAARMEPLYKSNSGAMIDLAAKEAQAVGDAKREEEMREEESRVNAANKTAQQNYKMDMEKYRNRAEAISGMASTVGSIGSMAAGGGGGTDMIGGLMGGGGGSLSPSNYTADKIAARNANGMGGGPAANFSAGTSPISPGYYSKGRIANRNSPGLSNPVYQFVN